MSFNRVELNADYIKSCEAKALSIFRKEQTKISGYI